MRPIHILYIALTTLALTGCNDISEEERFSAEPVAFTPKKNILIEDFTGQNCLNCPNAAEAVHAIQNLYGDDHVIAVAIHGGELKLPIPYGNPQQLATEEGDHWNTMWGVEEWPNGMIDRIEGLRPYTAWSAAAVSRLQRETPLTLAVELLQDEAATLQPDSITLRVTMQATASLEGYINLWLTEDSIVAVQRMPDGSMNTAYVHNHVFRTALTPANGETLSVEAGEERELLFGLRLPDAWKRENLRPIVFYESTKSGDGILQAARGGYLKPVTEE